MNAMLASVRNLSEARIALAGGCDWLDIKEPDDGALGRAPLTVVRDIVQLVAGRVPLSATIGDCWDQPAVIAAQVAAMADTGVNYVKVGIRARDISPATTAALRSSCAGGRAVIAVCMAEAAPATADLLALAASGVSGVMLDTIDKHGAGLTGLLSIESMGAFVREAHRLGLLAGLAGKLRTADIAALARCGADYLGFRSALCTAGERRASLDESAFAVVRAALHGLAPFNSINTSEVA
jgi:dihydroneopterin aldolase